MSEQWRAVRLGDVATRVTKGESIQWQGDAYVDRGVPFLRTVNVRDGFLELRGCKFIAREVHARLARSQLREGDVLISIAGTLGRACVVPRGLEEANINQDLAVVRLNPGTIPEFVVAALRGPQVQRQIEDVSQGGTRNHLNLVQTSSLSFLLPPLGEQRKIAAILSSVDDAIESTQAVIDQIQIVKKALMAELLTRGLPGRHKRFKQTDIGEVPEDWQVEPLSRVARLGSGGTPSRDRPEFWNGGIPWVKTGEITYGLITETEETISKVGVENSAAKIYLAGTLLMAMYGQGATRGRVALLGIPATVNQACLAISPAEEVDVRFLFHVFTDLYASLRELGHEGTQKNLNAKIVGEKRIPVPPREEQKEIADFLDLLNARVQIEASYVGELAILKAALMSVLLTGELRVTPDEVAA